MASTLGTLTAERTQGEWLLILNIKHEQEGTLSGRLEVGSTLIGEKNTNEDVNQS